MSEDNWEELGRAPNERAGSKPRFFEIKESCGPRNGARGAANSSRHIHIVTVKQQTARCSVGYSTVSNALSHADC